MWSKSQLLISLPIFHVKLTPTMLISVIQLYLALRYHQRHKTQSQTYSNGMVIDVLENIQFLIDLMLETPWR